MLRAFLDGQLFGEQDGDVPPRVLALHGWARDRRDFAGVLDEFGGIRLDLPGFGSSPVPNEAPTPQRVAEVVAPLVETLEAPRVVVGHSYGGRVGLHLAAAGLGIEHLILVGTPLVRPSGRAKTSARFRMARQMNAIGLISDATMERARQKHGSADYRASSGLMRDALVVAVNETYDELLPTIGCPVSLITGELDTAATPNSQHTAAEVMTAASVTVLPAAGHLIEAPHRTAVQEALRKVLEP